MKEIFPIYFDYASTTPVAEEVIEEMSPYFKDQFGNASSQHLYGKNASNAVKLASERVAKLINANPSEIIFTSGATESINTILKGIFEEKVSERPRIVTVTTEHKAVIDTCKYLEEAGADVQYVKVNIEGQIDWVDLKEKLNEETCLLCVMTVNNETGVIHPIKELCELAHKYGALFFTDATQAFGKIHIDVQELNIDFLCFSGHKIYAPKGIGGLYVKYSKSFAPLIHGGGHQKGFRSGTLNVPLIVAMGKSAELASNNMQKDFKRIEVLRDEFENSLMKKDNIKINGNLKKRSPYISNIQLLKWKDAEQFILQNQKEVAVAMGSACNAAVMEPSHVLKAMGLSDDDVNKSIRISFGNAIEKSTLKTIIKVIRNNAQRY